MWRGKRPFEPSAARCLQATRKARTKRHFAVVAQVRDLLIGGISYHKRKAFGFGFGSMWPDHNQKIIKNTERSGPI